MSKLIAAIPVKNNIKWTAPAVEHLLLADEVDEVWLYDNGSSDITHEWALSRQKLDPRLKIFDMKDLRIYDMWSHMIRTASHKSDVKLAILNNDIRLPHNAIRTMADRMEGYQIACIDRTVRGSEPIQDLPVVPAWWGEKTGWAFILDVDFWVDEKTPIDPIFRIWWGDDDLFRRAQVRGGKICIVKGVGCDHFEWSSDSEYSGDKWVDVEADRLDFINIWGQ